MRRFLYVWATGCGICAGVLPSAASITISNAATANMACSNGVCSPTAADAVLNVLQLESMLSGGNATVTTTGSGVQAGDIAVKVRLEWPAASTLALDAFHSIRIEQAVTVAGSGGVSLTTNDGGSSGLFSCGDTGRLQFKELSGVLTINGTAYVLVNSVASLASAIAANPSGAFALASDYDAKKDGTYAAPPIPTVFGGSFNGLGNTIANLSINDPTENAYVGLFAETGTGSTIANIRLIDEIVQGGSGSSDQSSTEFIGGLVGYLDGGSLAGSYTSGTVSGGNFAAVGGLAGIGEGAVTESGSAAAVSSMSLGDAGGLIGGATGTIKSSYATGNVSGAGFIGGLVGLYAGKSIVRSWASGTVSSSDGSSYVGGLAGMNQFGIIERSRASGSVTCQFACGGLVGVLGYGAGGTPKVSQSFATGSVTASENANTCAGGLAGLNINGEIANSYASGSASAKQAGGLVCQNINTSGYHAISRSYSKGVVTGASGYAGGLLGGDEFASTIRRAYWDMTTSGITDPSQGAGNVPNDPGIKGLSDSKLKSRLPKGFSPKIWNEDANINGGLPYLIANPPQQ